MNFLKYLFSKSYRIRFQSQYTKDMSSKFASEETQKREIYEQISCNSAKNS